YYNRFLFVTPQGEVTKYDKRHLFRMAKEQETYEMGSERVIINYMGWRILPMVCYDLRFPVWSRNNNDYDLMIYVASWPDLRSFAWKTLSQARAIENLSYLVSCNRVGEDIKMKYSGDSAIYNFKGETLANLKPYSQGVINFSLSLEELEKYRNNFPAHLDADKFLLQ
ncbi:MAG: amidohydrolase, partial [Bacteroidetes bacterium]|nr:amidohydrolase [Bacteroidota bacterium]